MRRTRTLGRVSTVTAERKSHEPFSILSFELQLQKLRPRTDRSLLREGRGCSQAFSWQLRGHPRYSRRCWSDNPRSTCRWLHYRRAMCDQAHEHCTRFVLEKNGLQRVKNGLRKVKNGLKKVKNGLKKCALLGKCLQLARQHKPRAFNVACG